MKSSLTDTHLFRNLPSAKMTKGATTQLRKKIPSATHNWWSEAPGAAVEGSSVFEREELQTSFGNPLGRLNFFAMDYRTVILINLLQFRGVQSEALQLSVRVLRGQIAWVPMTGQDEERLRVLARAETYTSPHDGVDLASKENDVIGGRNNRPIHGDCEFTRDAVTFASCWYHTFCQHERLIVGGPDVRLCDRKAAAVKVRVRVNAAFQILPV